MDPYYKYVATIIVIIIAIIALFVLGRKARKKHKRKVTIAVVLLFLSMISNRSFYWILYWDGPFYGRVVDAETGSPIAGANVAVTWEFEYSVIVTSSFTFANAKETVTDSDGKFFIPITFTLFFNPLTVLQKMNLLVFKPGYDSQPPGIQREMEKPANFEYSSDNKYFLHRNIQCTNYKECFVSLHEADSLSERKAVCTAVSNSFFFHSSKYYKIKHIISSVHKESTHVRMLSSHGGHDISEEIRARNELIKKLGLKEKHEQKKQ